LLPGFAIVDTSRQTVGEGLRFTGRLQVFRPSRTFQEDVRDTEMIDTARDQATSDNPG
jgi:hypothetical protein